MVEREYALKTGGSEKKNQIFVSGFSLISKDKAFLINFDTVLVLY